MMRFVVLTSVLLAAPAPGLVRAQSPEPPPERAVAAGIGWSTGIIGVEYVDRSLRGAPRLGAAVAVGFVGPSGRLSVGLLPPARRRVLPYVGVGVVTNLWGLRAGAGPWRLRETAVVPTLEGGVQLWPRTRRGLYLDLGAGVLRPVGERGTAWVPRVLVGGAF